MVEKSYDLLYIHELVQRHIKTTLDNWTNRLREICRVYQYLTYHNEPTGVTRQQKQVLVEFEKHFKHTLGTLSPLSPPKQDIKYRDYKEKIQQLNQWLKVDQESALYYPCYLSQFERIIQDYKQTLQKPLVRSFMQRTSPAEVVPRETTLVQPREQSKEVQEYLAQLQISFDKQTVEQILQAALPKEEKVKLTFEDNVSARAKRYLDFGYSEAEDSVVAEDDDEEGKNKVFSGIHFTDLSRVNVNQKYKYEKKLHFRDTVNQYQGLQNKYIPDKVIEDVVVMIKKHGLSDDQHDQPFVKVTKDHVRFFLDEAGHARYYEDLQLIYSKITGKPCPNIAKYVTQLYKDFDSLVDAFLSLDINRKNFLNSHYVLRQLLRRQGHKVPEDDLTCLKTLSRIQSHDEIYQKCCDLLNWNFTPIY